MIKRVCIDLRPLQIGHENRGIGMVIKSILENLEDDDNEYIFYTFEKNNPIKNLGIKLGTTNYSIVQTPTIKTSVKKPQDIFSSFRLIFHRFSKLSHLKIDAFVQFDFTLGIPKSRGLRTVVYAYDLIPLIMRNEYLPSPLFSWNHALGKRAKIKSSIRSLYYRLRYKRHYNTYKRCTEIISISKSTTESLINMLHINANKITTSPLAPISSNSDDHPATQEWTKQVPFMFYIGGTDSRKRVDQVISAFNVVRSRGHDINLILAGSEFKDRRTVPDNKTRDAIKASPYKEDIKLAGFITDEAKSSLYKYAHAFVFCSHYEGFGLPVTEAHLNGCPVVAYNNSSIPEAAGNAALLSDTNDFVDIAKNIIKLFDPEIRDVYITRGHKQVKTFSWKKHMKDFKIVVSGQ